MSRAKLEAEVEYILRQGPAQDWVAQALATRHGVAVEEVAALIASRGPVAERHPEDVAQWRLSEERRQRGTAAYRAWSHEEE